MEYGIQLYTLRKYTQTLQGIKETFERVKAMNCNLVQVSGMGEIKSGELKKIAEDTNIKICCTHSPFERMTNDLDKLATEHLEYGCKIIGIGGIPEKYKSSDDGIMKFCNIYNEISEKLKKYDMKVAYHNHSFEFTKKIKGECLFDYLIKNTVPDVSFIFDTYWAHFAGYETTDYIEKLGDRLQVLHLKDFKKKFGLFPAICEVGGGVIDFKKIIVNAERKGTKYAVIEDDNAKNPYKSVQSSWDYINKNLK